LLVLKNRRFLGLLASNRLALCYALLAAGSSMHLGFAFWFCARTMWLTRAKCVLESCDFIFSIFCSNPALVASLDP
jgi:hypothetical protein